MNQENPEINLKKIRDFEAFTLNQIQSKSEYKSVTFYSKNKKCQLSLLCDIYGSDKGEILENGHPYNWPSHTYADFYSRLFGQFRDKVKNVFECGLGTNNPNLPSSMGVNGKPGASLRVWRDFFPNANIFGADIDKDILFEEDRIRSFYMNQLDPSSVQEYFASVGVSQFDIMIDDGLHTFEAGTSLFENAVSNLASTGIYIIEDVSQKDLLMYKEFFQDKDYIVDYVCLFRPKVDLGDNSLIVVRRL